jgi:tetratricopeptide (TPR) repeat protein
VTPHARRAPRAAFAAAALLCALGSAAFAQPTPTPAPAFLFASPHEGRPSYALSKREGKRLDEAMAALKARDVTKAEKLLKGGPPASLAYRTARAYIAILRGKLEDARAELDIIAKADPAYRPALEALADVDDALGKKREAFTEYRAVLAIAPGDAHAKDRVQRITSELVASLRGDAEHALAAKNADGARKIALSLLELDPSSPAGYEVLSLVAESRAQLEDAYASAVRARALEPDVPKRTERVAELAMKTHRWAEAASLFGALAAKDPAFKERSESARTEALVQNLPEVARRAALSPRVTRAQTAALLSSLVPEVREAAVPSSQDVATDAIGRPERAALVRAIGLGFFGVSKETHRVGAETAVTRAELAGLLQRLASFVARGAKLPPCLSAQPAQPALEECGILSRSTSRTLGGREALSAIESAARAGRQAR